MNVTTNRVIASDKLSKNKETGSYRSRWNKRLKEKLLSVRIPKNLENFDLFVSYTMLMKQLPTAANIQANLFWALIFIVEGLIPAIAAAGLVPILVASSYFLARVCYPYWYAFDLMRKFDMTDFLVNVFVLVPKKSILNKKL